MSEENIQPTYKPRKRAKIKRAKINFNKCPECKTDTVRHDEEHCLDYCTKCGLVTRASLEYVGLRKADYKYNILII